MDDDEPRGDVLADEGGGGVMAHQQGTDCDGTLCPACGCCQHTPLYYALIGDYIKIGFSTRLRNRLTTLRVDHLLAIEPGGPEMERERHHDFAEERIDLRRENFRPSERLLDHIDYLRERYGLPHWATRPRTTTITRRHMEDA